MMRSVVKILILLSLIAFILNFACNQNKQPSVTEEEQKEQKIKTIVQQFLQDIHVSEEDKEEIATRTAEKVYQKFSEEFKLVSAEQLATYLEENRPLKKQFQKAVKDEVKVASKEIEKDNNRELDADALLAEEQGVVKFKKIEVLSQGNTWVDVLNPKEDRLPEVVKSEGAFCSDELTVRFRGDYLKNIPGNYRIGCILYGGSQVKQVGELQPRRGKLQKMSNFGGFIPDDCKYDWTFTDVRDGDASVKVFVKDGTDEIVKEVTCNVRII